MVQQPRRHQAVIQNKVGLKQRLGGAERQQAGMPRTTPTRITGTVTPYTSTWSSESGTSMSKSALGQTASTCSACLRTADTSAPTSASC